MSLLFVGLGGFFGSIARYVVYLLFNYKNLNSFPWATLLINVFGCLIIGVLSSLLEKENPYNRHLFLVGSVGFLGAFTTFSTFGLETLSLIKNQGFGIAIVNIFANVIFGILAVWAGRVLI